MFIMNSTTGVKMIGGTLFAIEFPSNKNIVQLKTDPFGLTQFMLELDFIRIFWQLPAN